VPRTYGSFAKNFGAPPDSETRRGDLRLEVIFVVPYKGMAIEGYYPPNDGTVEGGLVPGSGVPRETLDSIVAHAGIPPRVLDETNVEHEISCETGAPLWSVVWYDVRHISNEDSSTPTAGSCDFTRAWSSINAREAYIQKAQRPITGG
jgi:hypothetical protein